jgi:hypothetical protein
LTSTGKYGRSSAGFAENGSRALAAKAGSTNNSITGGCGGGGRGSRLPAKIGSISGAKKLSGDTAGGTGTMQGIGGIGFRITSFTKIISGAIVYKFDLKFNKDRTQTY